MKKTIKYYRSVWKPTFMLPFGLVSEFHITVRPGTRFYITVPEFFVPGEYRVICAPPNK
jgi:hypothetical protein